MTRDNINQKIINHLRHYDPLSIGIFGSFARQENNTKSDNDILIEFKKSPSLLTLIRIENELSNLIGIKVDLVTQGAIKNKRISQSINKDLVSIF